MVPMNDTSMNDTSMHMHHYVFWHQNSQLLVEVPVHWVTKF